MVEKLNCLARKPIQGRPASACLISAHLPARFATRGRSDATLGGSSLTSNACKPYLQLEPHLLCR